MVMDEIDRRILQELVMDGRLSVTELADQVSLSLSATSQRLRRLVDGGAIERFTVRLDPATVGRPIDALVDLRLPADLSFSGIDEGILALPEVVDAVHLTGRFDYQVRLHCRTINELDTILRDFKQSFGVEETSTRVVLSTVAGFPRQPTPA
ncbi:MAG TPA: Lrp/AsnC family transcriptional regulator [Acidimicrobiia bacterium]|nr:Lrp/AsnC family transcriptional regulator [Acidimicrobiia bacterium]